MTNSYWKLLAIDLDGTLIGWNRVIHDDDLAALRTAHDLGYLVALCTGRNPLECAGILAALNLPHKQKIAPGVFANGSLISNMADGKTLHAQTLPDSLAREVIDFFAKCNHATLVLADHPTTRLPVYALTTHGPHHEATTDWLAKNRVHADIVDDLPTHFSDHIVRLGTVLNPTDAPTLYTALQSHFTTRLATHSIYSPHYDCQILELFHPASNKWSGLEHLASLLNIPPTTIITVGDDINDLPMLQHAKLSFAMGNASDHVKSHAKRIAPSHADKGISQIIGQLLAGALEPTPALR